ncbi:DEKNAAC101954 [Brettanomyces naardenensis]|uniref:Aspartate aminotransferase n=1 Tax=Brettanomyces naardenensis TaxID=13370 RepID=A0A448YJS7_BRENA|nr:DEKNAAC101954 [Brettanomyces naardenensis]
MFPSRIRQPFRLASAKLFTRRLSAWANVPQAPPDKILGLNILYQLDTNPNKIDLGVGAYRTDKGEPWIMPSIRMAEEILAKTETDKEYAPILGSPSFIDEVQRLLFNHDTSGYQLLADGRVVTAQGISGTGSLRVLSEFLAKFNPVCNAILPNPTWANHIAILQESGIVTSKYRYYDYKTNGLDIDGLIEDLQSADPRTVALFHLCCHNPTGVDATLEQWDQIIRVISERKLIPLLDMAYQGFESGDPIRDLRVLSKFNDAVTRGMIPTYLLAQSFAKNMGLYGERVGTLSIVCADSKEAEKVRSQLARVVRPMYSSPPTHGSKLATIVLGNTKVYRQWLKDVKKMVTRLNTMRTLLYDKLTIEYSSPVQWDHLLSQKGMFAYTGLNAEQVTKLRERKSVYMTSDGRISLAGITSGNVDYLAKSIDEVTRDEDWAGETSSKSVTEERANQ